MFSLIKMFIDNTDGFGNETGLMFSIINESLNRKVVVEVIAVVIENGFKPFKEMFGEA